MFQTRLSVLRNKFFLLIGIIIFLSIFFIAFNEKSNETVLQQKIEKLELQNDAFSRQMEGLQLAHSRIQLTPISALPVLHTLH